ncbi:heterokaryon incompatibility protein (HET) domain-containing protein [Sarocladium implicatum]|nr:heterokaryon incompatibility protein (HET) domain-containing protein [Sarocladium implicatum]
MWLINTSTLQLHEFIDPVAAGVRYAILSHTWGTPQEEVSFKDFADLNKARNKVGFAKIEKTCEIARSQSLDYAWVDTCCIDKSSSAELSEAINSMFQWYRTSEICYIFLADLHDAPFVLKDGHHSSKKISLTRDEHFMNTNLAQCRWFSRGWTLQELIAPRTAVFYDSKWHQFATKHDIAPILSVITGIDEDILVGDAALGDTPVFTRMSWAAKRQTTRVEDLAYCLLGIFDTNFSLIYGEGPKAFRRLQEEIIRKTDDPSILAWSGRNPPEPKYRPRAHERWQGDSDEYRGSLAWAPCEFTKPPLHMDKWPRVVQGRFSPQTSIELKGAQGLIVRNASVTTRICHKSPEGTLQTATLAFLRIPCLNGYVYRLLRRCLLGHFLAGPTESYNSLSRSYIGRGQMPNDLFDFEEIVSTVFLVDQLSPKETQNMSKPVVEVEVSMQTTDNEHLNKFIMQSQPVWPISRWSEVDRCFAMYADELGDTSEVKLMAQSIQQGIQGPNGVHSLDILCCIGEKPWPDNQISEDSTESNLLAVTIIKPTSGPMSGLESHLSRIIEHAKMMKPLHWLDHRLLFRTLRDWAQNGEVQTVACRDYDGSTFNVTVTTSIRKQCIGATHLKYHVVLKLDVPNGFRIMSRVHKREE